MKIHTGLKYTDGTPICEGDTIVLWHDVQYQKGLVPFEREIVWDDHSAAYMTYNGEGMGFSDYLGCEVRDPNCKKITKKV